jgi:peptide-methionine (S)-S-oxide reductase
MVGYSGGQAPWPTYEDIKDHTECVLIRFDPARTSYQALAEHYWRTYNPTSSIERGQYRSFLAYLTPEQERLALATRAAAAERCAPARLRTTVEPATRFYRAEEYHQQYYSKHSSKYGCH